MDSLMPTMRSYEPSTASITDGDGMIAVAIRFTGPAGAKAPAPMPRRAVRRDGAGHLEGSGHGPPPKQAT
ncbi:MULTISPECIES: hypothetical protein [unclassified Streptomyces]|uniref:hypothetical protein n=1 Tax=unclassified Streptomyces TaxID=2593676 RepID=UPI0036FC4331